MPVYVNGTAVSGVQYLSGGFLIVPVPAGTSASQISVGTPPAGIRLNDTDPTIIYGNIGISIDGGTQQTISTLPSDGQRHSNVAVYTATGLSPGNHTIVVTKLSGTYTTLDGFTITES